MAAPVQLSWVGAAVVVAGIGVVGAPKRSRVAIVASGQPTSTAAGSVAVVSTTSTPPGSNEPTQNRPSKSAWTNELAGFAEVESEGLGATHRIGDDQ